MVSKFQIIKEFSHHLLGLVHIEVYTIRYSLYIVRFALCHRRDSATSTLHHLNVVCGGEQIVYSVLRVPYSVYFYVNEALQSGFTAGSYIFMVGKHAKLASIFKMLTSEGKFHASQIPIVKYVSQC